MLTPTWAEIIRLGSKTESIGSSFPLMALDKINSFPTRALKVQGQTIQSGEQTVSDLSIVVKPFYVPAIREPRPSIFTRVAAAVSHYRTGRILAAMDDRTLADIGASRSEAIWEDSRPIWERLDTLR